MKNFFKVFIIYAIFGVLIFFNSLNNKFMMDDYVLLGNPVMSQTKYILAQWNPYLEQNLGVLDSGKSFVGYYRPCAQSLYDFCYGTFKSNYWQYHLLSLFLFVITATLIFQFIEHVTEDYLLAFLAGLFFLIHPINVILVNYIVSNVLSVQLIFILGTILLLLGSLKKANDRTLYFLSLLCSLLSLFWYDIGVMTPVYLAVVVFFFRKDPALTKFLYLLPFFMISLFYFVLKALFLNGVPFLSDIVRFHMTGWEYLATLFRLIGWYIIQLFYPTGIVMQWVTPVLHEHLWWNCLGMSLAIIIFLAVFFRFVKNEMIKIVLAWIFISLFPVCLVAFRRPEVGALIEPHWFIFSSIGFFILLSYGFMFILKRAKILGTILVLILVCLLGGTSHAYNQLWADQGTYARFWVEQAPGFKLPYIYLADAYRRQGDLNKALVYYKLGLTDQSAVNVYLGLAQIDAQMSQWQEAETICHQAMKMDPHSALPYHDLGIIYLKQGQWLKAEGYFTQALLYDPLMIESRRDLAFILDAHGQYQRAVALSLKNLEIEKDDAETLFLLVRISSHQQNFMAVRKYANQLMTSKNDPAVLTRLGMMMGQMKVNDLAFDSYMKALHVSPNYKDAYVELGELLYNLTKYQEAIRIWGLGLSIDPTDQRFRVDIAKAVRMKSI